MIAVSTKQKMSWLMAKVWICTCMRTPQLPSTNTPKLCLWHKVHLPKYQTLIETAIAHCRHFLHLHWYILQVHTGSITQNLIRKIFIEKWEEKKDNSYCSTPHTFILYDFKCFIYKTQPLRALTSNWPAELKGKEIKNKRDWNSPE